MRPPASSTLTSACFAASAAGRRSVAWPSCRLSRSLATSTVWPISGAAAVSCAVCCSPISFERLVFDADLLLDRGEGDELVGHLVRVHRLGRVLVLQLGVSSVRKVLKSAGRGRCPLWRSRPAPAVVGAGLERVVLIRWCSVKPRCRAGRGRAAAPPRRRRPVAEGHGRCRPPRWPDQPWPPHLGLLVLAARQAELQRPAGHRHASLAERAVEVACVALQQGQGLRPLRQHLHRTGRAIGAPLDADFDPAEGFRLQRHRQPRRLAGAEGQGDARPAPPAAPAGPAGRGAAPGAPGFRPVRRQAAGSARPGRRCRAPAPDRGQRPGPAAWEGAARPAGRGQHRDRQGRGWIGHPRRWHRAPRPDPPRPLPALAGPAWPGLRPAGRRSGLRRRQAGGWRAGGRRQRRCGLRRRRCCRWRRAGTAGPRPGPAPAARPAAAEAAMEWQAAAASALVRGVASADGSSGEADGAGGSATPPGRQPAAGGPAPTGRDLAIAGPPAGRGSVAACGNGPATLAPAIGAGRAGDRCRRPPQLGAETEPRPGRRRGLRRGPGDRLRGRQAGGIVHGDPVRLPPARCECRANPGPPTPGKPGRPAGKVCRRPGSPGPARPRCRWHGPC